MKDKISYELEERVRDAVRHFWRTRNRQAENQGSASGVRDKGARSAVTGGAHLNGFVELIHNLLVEAGIPEPGVYLKNSLELPGFFRPQKKWDLLVVVDSTLLATIELKAQVGPSFGNNFNNRSEEAVGNATDYWTAYREGAYGESPRPWLGYLILLEETEKSLAPVRVKEPHFPVFPEFRETSYAKRYELLLKKLVRERLYDATCLLLSKRNAVDSGSYREPSSELTFVNFAADLMARSAAFVRFRESRQASLE
jgi:hypothetical protein